MNVDIMEKIYKLIIDYFGKYEHLDYELIIFIKSYLHMNISDVLQSLHKINLIYSHEIYK